MKKIIYFFIFFLFSFPLFSETIVLKSGSSLEGKIIERTDEYIKIDFQGIPLTYYFDQISTIDGQKIQQPLPEEPLSVEPEMYRSTKEAYEPEDSSEDSPGYGSDAFGDAGRTFPEQESGFKEEYQAGGGSEAEALTSRPVMPPQKVDAIAHGIILLIFLPLFVLMVISCWKVFIKAGQPGWACIVPIYNIYIILIIGRKPIWWLFLFFIPYVSIVMNILAHIAMAENFGKGIGFGIGLAFLPFVFYPILAFGSAEYIGSQKELTASV
jgi:hypothetical protein